MGSARPGLPSRYGDTVALTRARSASGFWKGSYSILIFAARHGLQTFAAAGPVSVHGALAILARYAGGLLKRAVREESAILRKRIVISAFAALSPPRLR